jgi:hypothetical protein
MRSTRPPATGRKLSSFASASTTPSTYCTGSLAAHSPPWLVPAYVTPCVPPSSISCSFFFDALRRQPVKRGTAPSAAGSPAGK